MAPWSNDQGNGAFYTGDGEPSTAISLEPSNSASSTGEENSSTTIKPRKRCSVSFSAGASIHVDAVMSIDDYSESEKFDCWFQADEIMEIRREVKEIVGLMNRNVPMDDISRVTAEMSAAGFNVAAVTTHGLEGKTKAGKRHRKEVRLASLAAVFDEQNSQDMDGICDPMMIARAYAEYSYPTQMAAFQRATLHQKETADFNRVENQPSPLNENACSADTSSEVVAQALVESTKSDAKEFLAILEQEVIEKDAFENPSYLSPSIGIASCELVDETIDNDEENFEKIIENLENDDRANDPFFIGPLRLRDRFACLLPGSSNNTPGSLMGAFRVVQM